MLSLLPQSVDNNSGMKNNRHHTTNDIPIANTHPTIPTSPLSQMDKQQEQEQEQKQQKQEQEQKQEQQQQQEQEQKQQEQEQQQKQVRQPPNVDESPLLSNNPVLTCEPEEELLDTHDSKSDGYCCDDCDNRWMPSIDLESSSRSYSSAPAATTRRGKSSVDSLTKSLESCATDFTHLSLAADTCSSCMSTSTSLSTTMTQKRIVAIGDLHGDLETTKEVLHMAGLTDKAGSWCGKNDIMVQLGDVADRGPDTLGLFRYLRSLQQEASKAGGEVILIMGNHELMTLMRKNHRLQLPFLRDPFSQRGEVGSWLHKLPIMCVIDGTVFAHGGVSPYWAQLGCTRTNNQAQRAMKDYLNMCNLNAAKLQFPVFGDKGPAWYRHYAYTPDEDKVRADLESALKSLGAKRMVVAHSPTRSPKVLVRCEGKFIDIDTKISRFFKWPDGTLDGGHLSALEIIGDRVTAIYPDGREVISES